ncbi:tRNA (adenosine(37)-N6)-threonylcarbamoyltransferase complex ATPase subunit type 1 TsaE [Cyanobium sp. Morenito 9A2]|uniref:tRNA (adenosine(37)-N6)-threonylcarbamoyltransferase complex ATPase subunit type 1 TsaE n=1 Tax=Cyanobium sp. Morenito 9A2 TaxID=2823718 RepID=UPI0020CF5ACB|nr:tRNA (adenosine(37)-N6)-threonylcarbamoyltransferase complex ATPase subunit type 1 TsaE [Cyanobium sp. Morenito 9A2]MCP9849490.1 tRNA (adenosine(37)-N6)-threonylcarbamoyltransferase complex ATPase subunit type 1 TsaE [Cyanobium sp. Morenito 9A2]
MNQRDVFLADPEATARLGKSLAAELLELKPSGRLLLLRGQLGAGKTSLVQGLAAGLGIDGPITSPTFALAQHYEGSLAGEPTHLVHLDLYRLEAAAAASDLYQQEEEEALALAAVLAVEWPERLPFVPSGAWRLDLEPEGEGRRARLFKAP